MDIKFVNEKVSIKLKDISKDSLVKAIEKRRELGVYLNLSPSAIKLYEESQMQFYLRYILNIEPTDTTIECYGKAGSLVHNNLELAPVYTTSREFYSLWGEQGLNELKDYNGEVLSKEVYFKCYDLGYYILKSKNFEFDYEEEIIHNLRAIKAKGLIDVLKKDKTVILDWKTSNSISDFEIQAKHYAWSVYKKYNIIPKVYFYYLKLRDFKEYIFSKEDLEEYEVFLRNLEDELLKKGLDYKKYTFGKWKSIFNGYSNLKEVLK